MQKTMDNYDLGKKVLFECGLNPRASFYLGRGVNRADLNEDVLINMFVQLLKIDLDYASQFVEMVKQMDTLGATEFINSFLDFARNDFKTEGLTISTNNISFEGAYDQERDTLAIAAVVSALDKRWEYRYQKEATEGIRHAFFSEMYPLIMKINPEFTYDFDKYDNRIKGIK